MAKCWMCDKSHNLLPQAFFIDRICETCMGQIKSNKSFARTRIDSKYVGSARFPSVYRPIDAKWNRWEKKQLTNGGHRMQVVVTHGGNAIIGPHTDPERQTIRSLLLGLPKTDTGKRDPDD